MTPRKKYVILGAVAGIGWVLAIGSLFFLYTVYKQYGERVSEERNVTQLKMPPEETLKKMEAAGVTRNEVAQVLEVWNRAYIAQGAMAGNWNRCLGLIMFGNGNRSEFVSCAAFVQNATKHLELTVQENSRPASIINSTLP
jgi:hypothetical protein